MYKNRLSGKLIFRCAIDTIDYPHIVGYIPESITAMSKLKELLLQINLFEGFECLRVYGSACRFDMPNLQRLDVSGTVTYGLISCQHMISGVVK